MNQTTNLGLPQWEDTDTIKREDLNSALNLIDTAMGKRPVIEMSTYVGTGTYGGSNRMRFRFSKKPDFMLIVGGFSVHLIAPKHISYILLDSRTNSLVMRYTQNVYWDGLEVYFYNDNYADYQANALDVTYHVLAFFKN